MDPNHRECYILQHTAQIFGGNSGGPLVAKDGTAIGINTWGRDVGFNYALTLPQLAKEIGDHVTGAVWRKVPR